MSNYDKIVDYCAERVVLPTDIFTVESLLRNWKRPAALIGYPLVDVGILLRDKLLSEDPNGICGYSYKEIDGDLYLCDTKTDESYYFFRILYRAIERVALSKRYRFGNSYVDSESASFVEDFSGIAVRGDKPYLEWVKGSFEQSEISKGKEKERLCAILAATVKDSGYLVKVPLDEEELNKKILAAIDNTAKEYLMTWNYVSGNKVLVSKKTQRVYIVREIFFKVFWLLLKETGLKRIATTDERVTIVMDD